MSEFGKWQPIDTAPKDGTDILIWERYSTVPFVGYFGRDGWEASKEHVNSTDGVVESYLAESCITHWMPLPQKPEEA